MVVECSRRVRGARFIVPLRAFSPQTTPKFGTSSAPDHACHAYMRSRRQSRDTSDGRSNKETSAPPLCEHRNRRWGELRDSEQKLVAKMRLPALVPDVRGLDIFLGGRPDDHRLHSWVVRMRSRTSSNGAPARGAPGGPSLSNSSILRSSSSRCATVIGIACGVSYRLSQISSRSSSRCSTVRVLISIAATPIILPGV